jgi:mono/diheme cytochrome c family protein
MLVIPTIAAAALFAATPRLAAADATDNWAKNCASCHGPDGAGHTKAGRMAQVKDMTDAKYQGTFTDDQAVKQIKEGFKDSSGKEKMKAFADKFSDAEVKALVQYVRSFKH